MARRKMEYNPVRDYYDILGIKPGATRDEVQQQYRQKAKQLHPDVNPDRREWATEQFQLLNEAYDVLSDTDLRRKYDEARWPHSQFKSSPRYNDNSRAWSADDRWWEKPHPTDSYRRGYDFYTPYTPVRERPGAWLEKRGLGILRPGYAALVDLFNSPYRYVLNLLGVMIMGVLLFQGLVILNIINLPADEIATDDEPAIAASNATVGTVVTVPATVLPATAVSYSASLRDCAPDILLTIKAVETIGRVLQIKADYRIANSDTISDTWNVSLIQVNVLSDTQVERIRGTEIVEPNIDFILSYNPSLSDELPSEDDIVTPALQPGTYWLRWTPILSGGDAYRTCDHLIHILAS